MKTIHPIRVWSRDYSACNTAMHILITTQEEWISRWGMLLANVYAPNGVGDLIPKLDFKKNVAVFLTLGSSPTGGYSIVADKISLIGEKLVVDYTEYYPSRGSIVTMAFTAPYYIAAIPRKIGKVKITDSTEVEWNLTKI